MLIKINLMISKLMTDVLLKKTIDQSKLFTNRRGQKRKSSRRLYEKERPATENVRDQFYIKFHDPDSPVLEEFSLNETTLTKQLP